MYNVKKWLGILFPVLFFSATPPAYGEEQPQPYQLASAASQTAFVKQKIREYFPGDATMLRIADCESDYRHWESDGSLLRNKPINPDEQGSTARGAFQVLMRIHGPEMKRLGLNANDVDDYMTYVRYLKRHFGYTPWNESKKCWG